MIDETDPSAFYGLVRRYDGWLTYERDRMQVFIGGVSAWATDYLTIFLSQYRNRVIADLRCVEHGIEPPAEPEVPDGGATLFRLPGRRRREFDPPVRPRPANTGGPGAASPGREKEL